MQIFQQSKYLYLLPYDVERVNKYLLKHSEKECDINYKKLKEMGFGEEIFEPLICKMISMSKNFQYSSLFELNKNTRRTIIYYEYFQEISKKIELKYDGPVIPLLRRIALILKINGKGTFIESSSAGNRYFNSTVSMDDVYKCSKYLQLHETLIDYLLAKLVLEEYLVNGGRINYFISGEETINFIDGIINAASIKNSLINNPHPKTDDNSNFNFKEGAIIRYLHNSPNKLEWIINIRDQTEDEYKKNILSSISPWIYFYIQTKIYGRDLFKTKEIKYAYAHMLRNISKYIPNYLKNLSNLDLSYTDLSHCDFSNSILSHCDFLWF